LRSRTAWRLVTLRRRVLWAAGPKILITWCIAGRLLTRSPTASTGTPSLLATSDCQHEYDAFEQASNALFHHNSFYEFVPLCEESDYLWNRAVCL